LVDCDGNRTHAGKKTLSGGSNPQKQDQKTLDLELYQSGLVVASQSYRTANHWKKQVKSISI
jgi:hypothetical protein